MDRLAAMELFVRVAETGSFSAVARETGFGQPAVSKQIAALEAHLGAQLIRRTSRSLSLTEAGQLFYEAAVHLLKDFDAARSLVGHGQATPSGLLRVTVAPVFGRLYIVPRLPDFFALYPGITVELSASERRVNLIEEGIDLAIRSGELVDSTMVARTIASSAFITVATPTYLEKRGTPLSPNDLAGHTCVVFAPHGTPRAWRFKHQGEMIVHHPSGPFRTADAEQVRAAVLADLGLAHGPSWIFAPDIAAGTVRVVLRDDQPAPLPISAVHHAGRRLPTRVRVFIDFLADVLARDEHFAEG